MPSRVGSVSFTSTYQNRLSNQLVNHVKITETFSTANPVGKITTSDYKALWDTGAQATCITEQIATDLNLTPVTFKRVKGAYGGETTRPAFRVCLYLPNMVVIENLLVTQAEIGGADVLIGMDVIVRGDFAVSNFNGVTTFSFRCPSGGSIDFNTMLKGEIDPNYPKIGKYDPCFCGSGKQFKFCHWKS